MTRPEMSSGPSTVSDTGGQSRGGPDRFADWLASELGFPFEVTFETPPPVTIDDMAAAYHRLSPSSSLEEWRIVIEDDWPTAGKP